MIDSPDEKRPAARNLLPWASVDGEDVELDVAKSPGDAKAVTGADIEPITLDFEDDKEARCAEEDGDFDHEQNSVKVDTPILREVDDSDQQPDLNEAPPNKDRALVSDAEAGPVDKPTQAEVIPTARTKTMISRPIPVASRMSFFHRRSSNPPPQVVHQDALLADRDDLSEVAQPARNIQDEFQEEDDEDAVRAEAGRGSGWAISILCMGLGLIAACVIIPQADANRRLIYERQKLQLDLAQIQNQVAVNREFLHKLETDPQLALRLAQRQMKLVRDDVQVLDLKPDGDVGDLTVKKGQGEAAMASADAERMSPFFIVNVPPPAPLPPYRSIGGTLTALCLQPRVELYLMGAAMFMVAVGLVMGDIDAHLKKSID